MNICINKQLMTLQGNNPSHWWKQSGYLGVVELGENFLGYTGQKETLCRAENFKSK